MKRLVVGQLCTVSAAMSEELVEFKPPNSKAMVINPAEAKSWGDFFSRMSPASTVLSLACYCHLPAVFGTMIVITV